MKSIPDPEDLEALRARIGDDPEKCAKFETYVTLLSTLDEDLDEGQDVDKLDSLRSQIDAARRALDA
jgi:hypothetical protein